MSSMYITLDTSHFEMSPLSEVASKNIPRIGAPIPHYEFALLLNIALILISPIGPCQQAASFANRSALPSGSLFRQSLGLVSRQPLSPITQVKTFAQQRPQPVLQISHDPGTWAWGGRGEGVRREKGCV